jgi:signal transduction histidine kinase/CheY-like chemotaxis protein
MSRPADRPLIWITDDSAVEAKFTQRALGDAYEFEYFPDGSIVLERLAATDRQPDLLLLDWVMPGVSGDEVCRFLRSQPKTVDLPIILVTASRVETADIVQGLSSGANDYLARPFVSEELRARVDNAIRAKRLREVAVRERNRLRVINRLGRAFVDVGPRLDAVFDVLASTLVEGLCDGCAITTIPGLLPGRTVVRHREREHEGVLAAFTTADPCNLAFANADDAKAKLPAAYHRAIDRYGMSALAVVAFPARSPVHGVITVLRDRSGTPFEPEDIVTIETCLEYAAMALEKALRFDAERALRKQLETILENMPISIIVAEPDGSITHINQTALAAVPMLRGARNIADTHELMALHGLDGQRLPPEQSPLNRALRGETVRGTELEIRFDGQSPRFLRTSAVALHDAHGSVTSAILAFDDTTAERLAAAEREQAIELQRYVLGIVSHDLRSPLQTLVMGCEGIKLHAAGNPQLLRFVSRMEATTNRMRGIIEQLLDVVRTQLGGGIPVSPAEVELGEVVSSVVSELSMAYPSAKFEQKLTRVRGTWDRDRLAQVVSNLLGNALQHGEKQSPVWIETEEAGSSAVLRVRNRSLGQLSDEQIENIFAPFRRTKQPTGGSGGLGLGLYIASEILRAHAGEISVESDPTTTTFVVRLPLQPTAVSRPT